jgi:hypothetical protein
MGDKEQIIAQITAAFAAVEYPGDWRLRGSDLGDEPYLLEEEFKGKTDWHLLDAAFLDQAPDGFGSALSFFSDEAFHFYLPAYLICDLRGQLKGSGPAFHLWHGLDDSSRHQRLCGARTHFDYARYRFSIFNREEAAAVVAYLSLHRDENGFARPMIDQALKNYWYERAA